MKFEWRNFLLWLVSAILMGILFCYLISCSAQYHLQKYQSKGGICGKIDTVTVVDSFPVNYRDTIIWRYYTRDSIIMVNDRVVPKTRYEIKTDYKIHHDTLTQKETIIKYQTKQQKSEDRKMLVWLAMAFLAVIAIYLIKKK